MNPEAKSSPDDRQTPGCVAVVEPDLPVKLPLRPVDGVLAALVVDLVQHVPVLAARPQLVDLLLWYHALAGRRQADRLVQHCPQQADLDQRLGGRR